MKVLFCIDAPVNAPDNYMDLIVRASGFKPASISATINASCVGEAIGKICTSLLAATDGVWWVGEFMFPEEGTHRFNRIVDEFDIVMFVEATEHGHIRIIKAQQSQLECGDRFNLVREHSIRHLLIPEEKS